MFLCFLDHKYYEAIEEYGRAIECDNNNAVYYSNRAFAQLKLELFGFAISDAEQAIKIDPKYAKVSSLIL